MTLDNITFYNGASPPYWLSDTELSFIAVIIQKSNLIELSDLTFNSGTFSEMETLIISDLEQLSFYATLQGLNKLSTLRIKNINFFHPSLNQFNLAFLNETLTTLQVSNARNHVNAWSPIRLLGNGQIYSKVKEIDYSNNDLFSITFNSTSFYGVKLTIETINMANSNISQLGDDAFSGCEKLTTLRLNGNQLKSLSSMIFNDLKNLKRLYLENNNLTTLPSGLLSNLMSVNGFILNINENLWNCDPDIVYVRKLLNNNLWSVNRTTMCVDPPELKDVRIIDLWCTVRSCKISCKDTNDENLKAILEIFDMVCIDSYFGK